MRRRDIPVFRPRRRRSRLWIVAIAVFGIVAIGAGVLFGGGYWYLSRSVPERDGTLHFSGLQSEVRVYWDDRGVPHIEASHLDDLFFAQGYVTAQDRLWQMDLYRRVAGGRLAEVLGESQLEQDKFFRTLGFRQAAEASAATAGPEALRMAEAYAAGVTAYIDEVTSSRLLPIEFRLLGYEPEPWTVIDTLLVAKLMAFQLSGNWGQELQRYNIAETLGWDVLHEWLPEYPDIAPTITTWAHMNPVTEIPVEDAQEVPAQPSTDLPEPTPNSAQESTSGEAPTSANSAPQPGESSSVPAGENSSVPTDDNTNVPAVESNSGRTNESDSVPALEDAGEAPTVDIDAETPAESNGSSTSSLQKLSELTRFVPPPFVGSNSWAVAPEKSATGGALFANDPHMQFGIPALWHQVHLVLEGDFNAIGISVPGVPGVVFGRNEHIAWAITALMADSQDLFIHRVNPDNPQEFFYRGEWEPARVREEVIHVKGRSEPVVYEVLETPRHGPVLNPILEDELHDVLSIQWTALGATREINALLPLMRASNFEEFEAALDMWDMPALSLLYADVEGNIGYKATGLLPVRPAGGGRYPLPAWTGEHDWVGTIPKDEMPRAYNPDSGFIVTANNLPVDADYPYYIGDEFGPWRALRITEVLAAGDDFTVDDMRELQLDIVNTHARYMLPVLTKAVDSRLRNVLQPNSTETAALTLLERWDYVERVERPEPFIWHLWLEELYNIAIKERLGFTVPDSLLLDHVLLHMVPAELEEVATRAFRAAVRRAETLQGNNPNEWQWGRWHRMTVYHPVGESVPALGWLFNVGDWPIPGSGVTPYAAGFDNDGGLVNHGASWRIVVDLASGVGYDVLLPGNSGHVLSPAYKDQAETWFTGELSEQQWSLEQYRRGALLRLLPE